MEFRDAELRIGRNCLVRMMHTALMVLLHHWVMEYLMYLMLYVSAFYAWAAVGEHEEGVLLLGL